MRIKLMTAIMIATMCYGCRGSRSPVEKTIENGIEVILNGAQPIPLKGEPLILTIEKTLNIDTEDDAIAALGITDIQAFDVDKAGNVIILIPPTGRGNCIFKLSPEGRLLASFGLIGQGPNEMEYPNEVLANDNGEIWVFESPKNKILVFDDEGKPISEGSPIKFEKITPLTNGSHLVSRLDASDLTQKFLPMVIELYDTQFRLIKELDKSTSNANRTIYEQMPKPYVNGIQFIFLGKASGERIYIGNSERGYEIDVFDLGGQPVRKIRKEFAAVPVPDEYKKKSIKDYLDFMPGYAKKIYFPQNWHAFHGFFPDEDGRLFVMTYEPGGQPGEYIYDIFNRDGLLIAQTSFNALHRMDAGGYLLARIRGDRLYAVQEKPSGFKQVCVYRMVWES